MASSHMSTLHWAWSPLRAGSEQTPYEATCRTTCGGCESLSDLMCSWLLLFCHMMLLPQELDDPFLEWGQESLFVSDALRHMPVMV